MLVSDPPLELLRAPGPTALARGDGRDVDCGHERGKSGAFGGELEAFEEVEEGGWGWHGEFWGVVWCGEARRDFCVAWKMVVYLLRVGGAGGAGCGCISICSEVVHYVITLPSQ